MDDLDAELWQHPPHEALPAAPDEAHYGSYLSAPHNGHTHAATSALTCPTLTASTALACPSLTVEPLPPTELLEAPEPHNLGPTDPRGHITHAQLEYGSSSSDPLLMAPEWPSWVELAPEQDSMPPYWPEMMNAEDCQPSELQGPASETPLAPAAHFQPGKAEALAVPVDQIAQSSSKRMPADSGAEPTGSTGSGHHSQGRMSEGVYLSSNKQRLRWTPELHELFVSAVHELGGADRSTPKGILRLMGKQGLTIYHVKSHLQKYRLAKLSGQSKYSQPATPPPQGADTGMAPLPPIRPGSSGGGAPTASVTSTVSEQDIEKDAGMGALPKSLQISEALRMQMEVQKRLHEQLEVQRQLQLRIEAQGKYLQQIIEEQQANARQARQPPHQQQAEPQQHEQAGAPGVAVLPQDAQELVPIGDGVVAPDGAGLEMQLFQQQCLQPSDLNDALEVKPTLQALQVQQQQRLLTHPPLSPSRLGNPLLETHMSYQQASEGGAEEGYGYGGGVPGEGYGGGRMMREGGGNEAGGLGNQQTGGMGNPQVGFRRQRSAGPDKRRRWGEEGRGMEEGEHRYRLRHQHRMQRTGVDRMSQQAGGDCTGQVQRRRQQEQEQDEVEDQERDETCQDLQRMEDDESQQRHGREGQWRQQERCEGQGLQVLASGHRRRHQQQPLLQRHQQQLQMEGLEDASDHHPDEEAAAQVRLRADGLQHGEVHVTLPELEGGPVLRGEGVDLHTFVGHDWIKELQETDGSGQAPVQLPFLISDTTAPPSAPVLVSDPRGLQPCSSHCGQPSASHLSVSTSAALPLSVDSHSAPNQTSGFNH